MPPTKDEILASISRLELKLRKNLHEVNAASGATTVQREEVRYLTEGLVSRLSQTRADVSDRASDAEAFSTWDAWANDSIVPQLVILSRHLNAILLRPLGCCTYPLSGGGTHTVCLTDSECDMPDSDWYQCTECDGTSPG